MAIPPPPRHRKHRLLPGERAEQRTNWVIVGLILVVAWLVALTAWAISAHALEPYTPDSGVQGAAGASQPDPAAAYRYQQAAFQWQYVTAVADQGAELDARWAATHACEEPGYWYADGWTRDGHFQGGLGISTQAWAENSAGEPSNALQASPRQQEEVAERILARYGPSAWACPAP